MRHSCAFLFLCLSLCAAAFPQDRGIIQCDPGSVDPVPAWIRPGRPHVIDQLSCGQMVSVTGVERGYIRIEIAEKSAYVKSENVRLLTGQEPLPAAKSQTPAAVPAKRSTREEEEQRKWNVITKDDVTLRDETLLKPRYKNGPRPFTATLRNNSQFPLSHLQMLVRLYDCADKPTGDYSNCEIIGEVKPIIPAPVPPGQTRRIAASMMFEATPKVNGFLAWSNRILGVRVE